VRRFEFPDKAQTIATIYEAFLLGISTQIRDGVPLSAITAAISVLMGAWDALLFAEQSALPPAS
jgi:TetR/AcrR family transcriptional repressor for divergent bdcA